MQIVIQHNITWDDVKNACPTRIYLGKDNCWWTHNENDLHIINSVPHCPDGSPILVFYDPNLFFTQCEEMAFMYGRHGIDALMAAHHQNCRLVCDDGFEVGSYLPTWGDYNILLDEENET